MPAISAQGRYVAFVSWASNLVRIDTNGVSDIFVRDRRASSTRLASLSGTGVQANAPSLYPSISSDGRFVAFESTASNLVPDDTNGAKDVFVHDLRTGATQRVSVGDDGAQPDHESYLSQISGDGRYVVFWSSNPDLDPSYPSPEATGLYVRDTVAGTTQAVPARGGWDPAISEHGRFVAFNSAVRLTPDDTDSRSDVYIHDRVAGTTRLVSDKHPLAETWECPISVSGRGRYVVYGAYGYLGLGVDHRQAQVLVRDMRTGATRMASVNSHGVPGDNTSCDSVVSRDGQFVVFTSTAGNLVQARGPKGNQVYGHNMRTGRTQLLSASSSGQRAPGRDREYRPAVSAAGRFIAFQSGAHHLIRNDTNDRPDIFLRDRGQRPLTTRRAHTARRHLR